MIGINAYRRIKPIVSTDLKGDHKGIEIRVNQVSKIMARFKKNSSLWSLNKGYKKSEKSAESQKLKEKCFKNDT